MVDKNVNEKMDKKVTKSSRLPPRSTTPIMDAMTNLVTPQGLEVQRMRQELETKTARIKELEAQVVDEKVKGALAEGEAKSLRDQVTWLRSMLEQPSKRSDGHTDE